MFWNREKDNEAQKGDAAKEVRWEKSKFLL
jgi:hypothetical protein